MVHKDFIITPIKNIISNAVSSINAVGGMGISAMKIFFEQALFLQLMGALEQKCKCICWELATRDFEYRNEHFAKNSMLGYSTLSEKNDLFKDCIKYAKKYNLAYLISDSCRQSVYEDQYAYINGFSMSGSFSVLYSKNFHDLTINKDEIKEILLFSGIDGLLTYWGKLSRTLKNKYEDLENHNPLYYTAYVTRNRIAHNTKSYQQSSMSFTDMRLGRTVDNYLAWLALLIYIDEMFIKVFSDLLPYLQ